MHRNIGILLFVLSFAIFPLVVSGGDTGIIKLFEKYEYEWNNKSVQGLISCFHDDAKIRTGGDRAIVSKTEYKQHLVARFERFGKVKLDKPDVAVQGNEATAKVGAAFQRGMSGKVNFVFKLINENGNWLIIDQNY